MTRTLPTKTVTYELEILIDAPRARVWEAITRETDAWWLPDFHMVGPGSTVRLEARAGGRLIEELDGGGSLLWYTVQMCVPETSLNLVGHLAPRWGGPATTMLELLLEDRDGGTRLAITDALFGHVPDDLECLRDGWQQLFGEGLARHVANR